MTEMVNPREFSELCDRPGNLIRRLHQIDVAIFLEECSDFDLTPVQFGVLDVLTDGKTLDQVMIARQLGIDRNNAADVIRRLEGRGLLLRPKSTKDRRAKPARITGKGRRLGDDVFPAMVEAQRRFVAPLGDEEYDTLMNLMEKLVVENNEASRAHVQLKANVDKPADAKES